MLTTVPHIRIQSLIDGDRFLRRNVAAELRDTWQGTLKRPHNDLDRCGAASSRARCVGQGP
jgi:hypothetical protein